MNAQARLRTALAEGLEAAGRGLWRGRLPLGARAQLITWIMASPSGGGLGRRLAAGVAGGGAAALATDPAAALALIDALQARGARPILIAGDSHSRLYVLRERRDGAWLLPLHRLATAATARGLANPQSQSGQGGALREWLGAVARAGGALPLLLVFGQVDAEFVFTFKRLESDPPAGLDAGAFQAFCRETARAYADFAAGLAAPGGATLAAIFPPALSDAAWREGYLNAQIADQHAALDAVTLGDRLAAATIGDLAARTAEHALFNRCLGAEAQTRGLGWLDAFEALLGPGGVVDPAYLGAAAGRDHHLDAESVRPVLAARLWAVVQSTPQRTEGHG